MTFYSLDYVYHANSTYEILILHCYVGITTIHNQILMEGICFACSNIAMKGTIRYI